MFTAQEIAFMDSADEFLALAKSERQKDHLSPSIPITSRSSFPIPPVVLNDYRSLSLKEKSAIISAYQDLGVSHFIASNPSDIPASTHPLFDICNQLKTELHLQHPLKHPLEGHSEAVKRSGVSDATVKIYDLPKPINGPTYREVAETSDPFEVHLDGLGSGGTVQSGILYMDSAPLFGGFTFFYDMLALGIILAEHDMEAFRHLFLPDAFTALRPRGKGAIKVTTPIFYIDESNLPHVFFRKDSGEYRMSWRSTSPPLQRAEKFLRFYTQPFSPGSFFVPFSRKGCACLWRNRDMAHGRTGFIDGSADDQRRLLSRKWFMTSEKHAVYKHVPGMAVSADLAKLLSNQFGADQLEGEWLYAAESDRNVRIK